MFFFVFLLILVVFFLILPSGPSQIGKMRCDAKKQPHKWEYKDLGDGNGYLQCSECDVLPGDNGGSEL